MDQYQLALVGVWFGHVSTKFHDVQYEMFGSVEESGVFDSWPASDVFQSTSRLHPVYRVFTQWTSDR